MEMISTKDTVEGRPVIGTDPQGIKISIYIQVTISD